MQFTSTHLSVCLIIKDLLIVEPSSSFSRCLAADYPIFIFVTISYIVSICLINITANDW
nr:MAG TPA: hypothetical protein [Caudoviricetes sp.]